MVAYMMQTTRAVIDVNTDLDVWSEFDTFDYILDKM